MLPGLALADNEYYAMNIQNNTPCKLEIMSVDGLNPQLLDQEKTSVYKIEKQKIYISTHVGASADRQEDCPNVNLQYQTSDQKFLNQGNVAVEIDHKILKPKEQMSGKNFKGNIVIPADKKEVQ